MVMTYRQALIWGNGFLRENGIEEGSDARVLLCHAAQTDSLRLAVCANEQIDDKAYEKYKEYILRRSQNEPVSYITGEREFMGINFKVKPGILIPRPETEHLVEFCMENLPDNAKIIDLCTGSGAIAVSLAKYLENARITAVDISDEAIEVATLNAKENKVSDRVNVVKANALKKTDFGTKFDAVVSNPPYIPNEVVLTLDRDVKDFEPHLALCGGDDGLDFYRAITKNAVPMLNPGGLLVYEVGYDQAEQVAQIMSADFIDINFVKDLADINRVVYGRLAATSGKEVI